MSLHSQYPTQHRLHFHRLRRMKENKGARAREVGFLLLLLASKNPDLVNKRGGGGDLCVFSGDETPSIPSTLICSITYHITTIFASLIKSLPSLPHLPHHYHLCLTYYHITNIFTSLITTSLTSLPHLLPHH